MYHLQAHHTGVLRTPRSKALAQPRVEGLRVDFDCDLLVCLLHFLFLLQNGKLAKSQGDKTEFTLMSLEILSRKLQNSQKKNQCHSNNNRTPSQTTDMKLSLLKTSFKGLHHWNQFPEMGHEC